MALISSAGLDRLLSGSSTSSGPTAGLTGQSRGGVLATTGELRSGVVQSARTSWPILHGCVGGAKVLDAAVPPVCYESLRCWRLLRRGRMLRLELLARGEWQSRRCAPAGNPLARRRGTRWLGGGPEQRGGVRQLRKARIFSGVAGWAR
jgi:hypothetical protein